MVDDGAMLWMTDDLHGNELSAERQHVQLRVEGLVLLQHLRQDGSFVPPARELEYGDVVLLRLFGKRVGAPLCIRHGENSHHIVTLRAKDLVDLTNRKKKGER